MASAPDYFVAGAVTGCGFDVGAGCAAVTGWVGMVLFWSAAGVVGLGASVMWETFQSRQEFATLIEMVSNTRISRSMF
jgi:hypothetical protein